MFEYTVKRFILAAVTLFVVMAVTFFSMYTIPGGPYQGQKQMDPAVRAELEKRYNLDKPALTQFRLYLVKICHGDFGISLKTGRDINKTLLSKFFVSAKTGIIAVAVALFAGLFFGSAAAFNNGKWQDRVIIFFTTLFISIPNFVLATILLLVVCLQLKLLNVWSTNSPEIILPVIAMSLYPMSYITRIVKTSMLDVLGHDYIRTARAKGAGTVRVIICHALKNALIPVITYMGPLTAYIITGSFVIESVFTIGGLGTLFVSCITNRDYPMIMATTIFLAVLLIVINLICDLLCKAVDPRITFN